MKLNIPNVPVRSPRVRTITFIPSTCRIYFKGFVQYWILFCHANSSSPLKPCMRFLFIRPEFCRRLPSDSSSRRTPLPLANDSYCQVHSGLTPPSYRPCRAHTKNHLQKKLVSGWFWGWAQQDLNLWPADYESAALTVWAMGPILIPFCVKVHESRNLGCKNKDILPSLQPESLNHAETETRNHCRPYHSQYSFWFWWSRLQYRFQIIRIEIQGAGIHRIQSFILIRGKRSESVV